MMSESKQKVRIDKEDVLLVLALVLSFFLVRVSKPRSCRR